MSGDDARNGFAMSCSIDHADAKAITGFIRSSYVDVATYDNAIVAHSAAQGNGPFKSLLNERYDIYHDLVLRHYSAERIALQYYERGRGWQQLSYAALDRRVSEHAASWLSQGVSAGSKLCVVLPFGELYAVTVLCALRLGCQLSTLSPLGHAYLAPRLALLDPAFIVTESRYTKLLGDYHKSVLEPAQGPGATHGRSHTYLKGEVAALLFSPLHEMADQPVAVPCERLHRNALRDGLATLALTAGAKLAAPGMHEGQHQPALLFSALAAGGSYVHASWEDLSAEPGLLQPLALRSIGISARFRDLLLAHSTEPAKNWQHWFRNPEEPFDWQAWTDFSETLALKDVPHSNVLFDSSAPGAVVHSLRKSGQVDNAVLPAAGTPWQLCDVNGSGQQAAGQSGLFVAMPPQDKPPKAEELVKSAYLLLYGRRDDYLYAGTITPRRSGRVFAADEVLALVEQLDGVQGASWMPASSGGAAVHYLFVLLLFTGTAATDGSAAKLSATALDEVRRGLAEEFLPDRIEVYPLYARAKGKSTDQVWCQRQYLTGSLFLKSRLPVFQRLTELRGAIA